MKTDLELLKEYLQSEIDCGNHKLFIFDENNNATELKTIDGLNAITDLEQEIERSNNTINECADEILKELKENSHLSYGVALAIRQKLINYRELRESGNNEN